MGKLIFAIVVGGILMIIFGLNGESKAKRFASERVRVHAVVENLQWREQKTTHVTSVYRTTRYRTEGGLEILREFGLPPHVVASLANTTRPLLLSGAQPGQRPRFDLRLEVPC